MFNFNYTAASGAAFAVSSREPPAESFSSRSSGVSHTTNRPLRMMRTRSHTARISERIWELRITVWSFARCRMRSRISTTCLGSRPTVGSSRMMILREAQDGLGQADPLAVALGQVPDQPGAHILQMGQGQDLRQLVLPLLLGDLLQLRAEAQVLLHRHIRIQRRDLRQIADAGRAASGSSRISWPSTRTCPSVAAR